jgi:hypothetical protein
VVPNAGTRRTPGALALQVRGNLHMVSEVINECMDYGIVAQLRQHVVLERLHSKYLAPKPSLLDLARPGSGRPSHFRRALPGSEISSPTSSSG